MELPICINHVTFNTGRNEQISIRNFKFPPYDRIALHHIINQATSLEGVDIDDNIILKINADTCRYTATFAYGSYAANETFLISAGAKTRDAMNGLWDRLRESYAPKYQVSTPLKRKPTGPMVVDILLPCSRPEVLAYLRSSDWYNLCLRLGWAMLYPECIRV